MKMILTVCLIGALPALVSAQNAPSPVDGPSPKTQPVEPILEKDHSGPGRIGVRVVISKDTGLPVIVSLTRGGPADDYGFKVGDVIIKIDRNFTSTLTPDQLKLALHGEPGSGVELTVQRGDDPRLIVHSIQRRILPADSVEIPESEIMTEQPTVNSTP